jgi:3-hydroxybutyryl-CoA dehydrogenase
MSNTSFQSGVVIGTGMMGPGTAMALALGGLRTVLLSRRLASAESGVARAGGYLTLLASHGLIDPAQADRARGLLSASEDFDATVCGADIVIESALENMELKQELFARLDSIARPDAVLTSNTSGLSITAIASRCQRPERTMTTHFWNPAHLMPLVEVVQGEHTDGAEATSVVELLRQCGKTPVLVNKDTPGQLGNRLQMALVREAVNIVQEGIADAESVDLAAKTSFGMRLPVYGILEHMDMVGLDLGARVLDYVTHDLNNEPGMPKLMRDLLETEQLGVKSGRGFYDWSEKDAEAVKSRRDNFLIEFLKHGY